MTQPDYVPLDAGSRLRQTDELSVPKAWIPDRPSEHGVLKDSEPKQGKFFGTPGPGSGYALKLTRHGMEILGLDQGGDREDAEVVVSAIVIKRASLFSRAPVIHDVRFTLALLGYVGDDVPVGTSELRRNVIRGAAHDYFLVRRILESIPASTLLEVEANNNTIQWQLFWN